MSIMTALKKMIWPDQTVENKTATKRSPLVALATFGIPLAFAVVLIAQPVAAEINLSVITDVVNAFIDIIDDLLNLVIAIVPIWFIMQILAFIMGLLGAILAMIKFGRK